MEAKAKLLLLVVLMVGTVSVGAQKTTKPTTTQPPTETPTCQPITGNTCQVLQGPPGPPGTCSYSEVSLVKGVRDISTSLTESVKNLTEELINSLGRIELAVTQCNTAEPPCPRSLGLSSYKPAKSCREIFQCNPSSPSGYYWLKSTTLECREVYCDMDTTHCNITGGWMRVAYLNMTEPGASCPTSLRQINTPAKLCGRHTAPGCSGVTYPVDGLATARSVDRLGATSTTPLMLSNHLQMTSTPTMLTVSPSHMGTLADMFGHMPLDSLMILVSMVSLTVPVPSTLVRLHLPLLAWIISVNLDFLVCISHE